MPSNAALSLCFAGHRDALPTGISSATFWDVPLFWLNYCHPDGRFDRFAGAVVVESYTHLHASMKAEVSGADRGLDFAGSRELDAKSARHVPADLIGRLLDDGDIRKLQQAIMPKEPVSPIVRGRPVPKRSVGKR